MDLKSLLPQNFIDLNGLKKIITKIREEIKTNSYIHPMTHPATMIVQDNTNQFVTKEQKDQWTNKLDADANAVSASKLQTPVNINGVPFDGTQDINILTKHKGEEIKHSLILNSGEVNISIPNVFFIEPDIFISLYVDGIKLIENVNYTLNKDTKLITLNESYSKKTNIEIVGLNLKNLFNAENVGTNALTLNNKTGAQYDTEIRGAVGKYDGTFPLTSAEKGKVYLLPETGKCYVCLKSFENMNLSAPNIAFEELTIYENRNILNNCFKNIQIYDLNGNPTTEMFFKTDITKAFGVKVILEPSEFQKNNAMIRFDYTKFIKKCCHAQIVAVRNNSPWLLSSLENPVFAKIQYIDSVQIIIGVLNNIKQEKIEVIFIVYGSDK